MTESSPAPAPVVVVTGANGLVGSRACAALVERGATVRAVVRRPGTAPELPGVEERVGEFPDPDFASSVVEGATAVVTTVHPMGSDRETQHRVGVEGTPVIARAAADAGVERLVHVSTAGVYDRSPGVGDVDESSALVGDDGGAYSVTKRDTDAALADIDGITRVLVRPPAILGAGESSIWNTLRPADVRDDEQARHARPQQSFAWVHVDDLTALIADLATGRVATSDDPATGPVAGGCTVVNVAAGPATLRDYHETVTEAVGVDPVWEDGPAWTGRILADRARGWGWTPSVGLDQALAEIRDGLGEPDTFAPDEIVHQSALQLWAAAQTDWDPYEVPPSEWTDPVPIRDEDIAVDTVLDIEVVRESLRRLDGTRLVIGRDAGNLSVTAPISDGSAP
ncbi:NAD(P)-dependent oxidoreductase [uncultured Nocardioides sp.]|uniref:UDP-glucose 4-epimerase n=1 Tax=uncultured Nocardioides sp. TaxID=198441 RepID=A0A6J4NZM2_9ACTN|nr:NAD(P)H-binding protein [uncultured Nocardioides sp.]CAA9399791.1 MAG: UDP-glucose 4-epimerase [uncultured Nocardioides sp.]